MSDDVARYQAALKVAIAQRERAANEVIDIAAELDATKRRVAELEAELAAVKAPAMEASGEG